MKRRKMSIVFFHCFILNLLALETFSVFNEMGWFLANYYNNLPVMTF